MAYKRFGLGGQIIPFWKREIESLPKWQKGDPQIRIFLPTFWMKMIKPPEDTPSNQVYFVTHPQMTKMDIKNYLEKIYKVPVHNVRTQIKLTNNEQPGKTFIEEMTQKNFLPIDPVRDKMKMSVKWSEEYKEAVVVLGEGQTFKFPDIESSIAENERDKQLDSIQKTMEGSGRSQKEVEEKRAKDMRRQGIPGWFS